MAIPLKEILAQRKLSARSLSLAAGLTGDTVRNLLSGRARRPRGEVAQALADHLQVSVGVLYGREPLPAWPPPAVPSATASTNIDISEVVFAGDQERMPHPLTEAERQAKGSWSVPEVALRSLTVGSEHLIMVAALHAGDGFSRGDRLLVDTADTRGTPPGLHLVWDGHAVLASRCSLDRSSDNALLRMTFVGGEVQSLRLPGEVDVIGRIVGVWRML